MLNFFSLAICVFSALAPAEGILQEIPGLYIGIHFFMQTDSLFGKLQEFPIIIFLEGTVSQWHGGTPFQVFIRQHLACPHSKQEQEKF